MLSTKRRSREPDCALVTGMSHERLGGFPRAPAMLVVLVSRDSRIATGRDRCDEDDLTSQRGRRQAQRAGIFERERMLVSEPVQRDFEPGLLAELAHRSLRRSLARLDASRDD